MPSPSLPALILAVVAACRPAILRADDPPKVDPMADADRAAAAVVLARAEASLYQINLEEPARGAVALHPDALLQWSNPVAGSIHGSVFVWTDRGCPVAVGLHLQVVLAEYASGRRVACPVAVAWTRSTSRKGRNGSGLPGRADVGARSQSPTPPSPADTAGRSGSASFATLAKEFDRDRDDPRRQHAGSSGS